MRIVNIHFINGISIISRQQLCTKLQHVHFVLSYKIKLKYRHFGVITCDR